jgi:hypothetical protein
VARILPRSDAEFGQPDVRMESAGTKYETAVIVQWLEGEDDLIRDRINQLISLKNKNSLTDEETDTDYDE